MATRYFLLSWFFLGLFTGSGSLAAAQDDELHIRVNVNLVQLDVAVTDKKGNYVTGLRPQDFVITEDKISEKPAFFGEGNEPARSLAETAPSAPATPSGAKPLVHSIAQPVNSFRPPAAADPAPTLGTLTAGANVFILFDTSNYMYRGFAFAQDAIADFVRSLESASKLAFYSYSRDLSRASTLTADRAQVLRGVRTTVAGDDAALYNCLLLTVRDAAPHTGRKVIVVFSNGPDNASVVPPEDVAELAQSTGTVIYMISTREAQIEPISSAVFERMSKATGGKAYFAKTWRDEARAFASIRNDLAHLYTLSYYPQPNANQGWRTIRVKLVGDKMKKYHVRTRNGYRIQQALVSASTSVP
jgi:VWFA-related protein